MFVRVTSIGFIIIIAIRRSVITTATLLIVIIFTIVWSIIVTSVIGMIVNIRAIVGTIVGIILWIIVYGRCIVLPCKIIVRSIRRMINVNMIASSPSCFFFIGSHLPWENRAIKCCTFCKRSSFTCSDRFAYETPGSLVNCFYPLFCTFNTNRKSNYTYMSVVVTCHIVV